MSKVYVVKLYSEEKKELLAQVKTPDPAIAHSIVRALNAWARRSQFLKIMHSKSKKPGTYSWSHVNVETPDNAVVNLLTLHIEEN